MLPLLITYLRKMSVSTVAVLSRARGTRASRLRRASIRRNRSHATRVCNRCFEADMSPATPAHLALLEGKEIEADIESDLIAV